MSEEILTTREKIVWEIVASGQNNESYASERLNRMYCSGAYVKRTQLCQICPGGHEMMERRVRCSSATCMALAVSQPNKKPMCAKVWKVWQCSNTDCWRIMATAVPHVQGSASCSGTRGPARPLSGDCPRGTSCCELGSAVHRAVITLAMRKYIGEMDKTGLAPRHIRSSLRCYTEAPPQNGVPTYEQVARCVKILRSKYGERNLVASLKALVREFALHSGIDADKAFIFGDTLDGDGFPRVGKEEDDDALVLGISTVGLLEKLRAFQKSNIFALFHLDATIKLSEIGYPGITCGFSDCSLKYHLAAVFIVSRLPSIRRFYPPYCKFIVHEYPKIDAVLGDAEDAQFNALQLFPQFQGAVFIMGFFHILCNVRKRTHQFDNDAGATVYKGNIAMHF
ncbi:unnamed protein product [Phytophthora fragariaefolia]|uniref:Unnamed protein product n=1 Tax=Phytophthora fragariaefolia TaxID=1490495 RepID=A0A9W6XQU9_9STRA|nr:unnamed protein product [Phytophthora fragariaefolia]